MNIASSRLDQLVERLTLLTGEDAKTALERAVAEKLARIEITAPAARATALKSFFDRVSCLPTKDDRPIDAIVGYDTSGLPS